MLHGAAFTFNTVSTKNIILYASARNKEYKIRANKKPITSNAFIYELSFFTVFEYRVNEKKRNVLHS